MNNCNACPYPSWVDMSNVDTTHATIIWPLTGASNYVLKLYYNWDSLLTTVTTTDTFYTFSSLLPNSEYRVEVASLCGTDTSGWNEYWFNTNAAWMPIIYVTTTGSGNYTGRSWSNATTLDDACNLASTLFYQYGTAPEVWVAQGEYSSSIYLYPGVHVYGGLVGNEPANYDMSLRDLAAHTTVLSAYYSNALYQYYDATDSTACWVDGFTFTGMTYTVANLRAYGAMRNCIITNNTISSSYLISAECTYAPNNSWVSLENCSIVDNINTSSSYSTEMIRMTNARAENCLIARNTVRKSVVSLRDSSVLSHCDVVGNAANNSGYAAVSGSSYSTGCTSRLENSIVWGNTYSYSGNHLSPQVGGLLTGYHSAVEGGIIGEGNINLSSSNAGASSNESYPKFIAPPTNLQLNGGSACIDAAVGTPATTTDIEGNPRVYGSASDIGCYEYQGVDVCGSVIYAQVNEVTSYSARVVWDASYPSYIIYYKEQNASTWDSMTVNAATNSYMDSANNMMLCYVRLSGLSGLTTYDVRLRSVCSGGVSDDYELTFTTICPMWWDM